MTDPCTEAPDTLQAIFRKVRDGKGAFVEQGTDWKKNLTDASPPANLAPKGLWTSRMHWQYFPSARPQDQSTSPQ